MGVKCSLLRPDQYFDDHCVVVREFPDVPRCSAMFPEVLSLFGLVFPIMFPRPYVSKALEVLYMFPASIDSRTSGTQELDQNTQEVKMNAISSRLDKTMCTFSANFDLFP